MNGTQKTAGVDQGHGEFSSPAPEETIQHVAAKLRERNIEVVVVDDGDGARQVVLERLPEGAEAHAGKSKTLEDAGIFQALQEPGRYDFLRDRYMKMDRKTQGREIRKLIAAPDIMLGSVNALTGDGILVATSATGSQLGPYAAGGDKVIFVVGSQKIVPDLDTALKRIREHVFPWEDARVRERLNTGTVLGKILIIEREWLAGRMTVVLVRQPIGV
ncbi:MAG: lactate utilization protein [Chloroflexi bacterium]|nr:lactate utilization protein [Chloroflexota bacterium]